MPEIKRISRHRHVPEVIKKAQEIKNIELSSIKRREVNERRTRKDMPFISERKKQIVGTVHKYEDTGRERKRKRDDNKGDAREEQ